MGSSDPSTALQAVARLLNNTPIDRRWIEPIGSSYRRIVGLARCTVPADRSPVPVRPPPPPGLPSPPSARIPAGRPRSGGCIPWYGARRLY